MVIFCASASWRHDADPAETGNLCGGAKAPGLLALQVALNVVEGPVRMRVWDDAVGAFGMGAVAALWFSRLFFEHVGAAGAF